MMSRLACITFATMLAPILSACGDSPTSPAEVPLAAAMEVTAPSAPQNLTATSRTDYPGVYLAWELLDTPDLQYLYFTIDGGDWLWSGIDYAGLVTADTLPLNFSTDYEFKLRAWNYDEELEVWYASDWSNVASATTCDASGKPRPGKACAGGGGKGKKPKK